MEMENQPSDSYLHALKPIYGFSEPPGHWWHKFECYHIEYSVMKQFILDRRIFHKSEKNYSALFDLSG